MCAENAHRLAGLNQECLVAFEALQGLNDLVECVPVARRLADPTVDNEILRALRHFGVEVIHDHAQRGFGQPTLRL